MSNIKKSNLLLRLIEDAKKMSKDTQDLLTAERFLLALQQYLSTIIELTPEIIQIKAELEKNQIDLDAIRNNLSEAVKEEKIGSYYRGLYMERKLLSASQLAEETNCDEVTVGHVINVIFKDPNESLKRACSGGFKEFAEADAKQAPEAEKASFIEFNEEDLKSPEDLARESKNEIVNLVAEIKKIRADLRSKVFGQDNAIDLFLSGYFKTKMRPAGEKENKPRATFLFAGPPGVGKTLLANEAAASIGYKCKVFDMSGFSDEESVSDICGFSKSYRDAKEGVVTGYVKANPNSVLVFDEIEKAHVRVINLFLQVLEEGLLFDNFHNQNVSFGNTIIIFTSNAGRKIYEESISGDFSSLSRKVIINAIRNEKNPDTGEAFFPSAICSRFAAGNVVMFNHISAHDLLNIERFNAFKELDLYRQKAQISFDIEESVYSALLFSEGGSVDARTVAGRTCTFFSGEIHELLRMMSSGKFDFSFEKIKNIQFRVDLKNASEKIVKLFKSDVRSKILVFASEETVELCKQCVSDVDVVGAQTTEAAIRLFENNVINSVFIDVELGALEKQNEILNVEDLLSEGRDFLKYVKEFKAAIPTYILETREKALSTEEKESFFKRGARGIVSVVSEDTPFAQRMKEIQIDLYQQDNMIRLARENKLVSFETSQSVSEDGETAVIRLFDFRLSSAIDAADADTLVNSVSMPNVEFDDVIGADGAKEELKYFVDYLKDPSKYVGTGVKAPRGVILYGPPGTGKTMLAKAMAKEAGVAFVAAEGNQFVKPGAGMGSEKVHEVFRTARKYAPAILFIDEIDAVGKERTGFSEAAENALTALLTNMDGFKSDTSKPVFVLAATNFDVEPGSPKSLDQALMRRFDRRIYVDLPGKADRIKFLNKKREENKALCLSDEQIENIAVRSTNMSLALLDSVVELALRSAIRAQSTVVTDEIFEDAFETFNFGEEKKWDASQLERVARHEAGHALLHYLCGKTPTYLTIVARGNHGGYMQRADDEDKYIHTKKDMLDSIKTSLAGRAAEIVCYGEEDGVTTGAAGDLISATEIAKRMICSCGMDAGFGLAVINSTVQNGELSDEIHNEINRILSEQLDEAVRLIREKRQEFDSLVEALLLKNHLSGEEIENAIAKK